MPTPDITMQQYLAGINKAPTDYNIAVAPTDTYATALPKFDDKLTELQALNAKLLPKLTDPARGEQTLGQSAAEALLGILPMIGGYFAGGARGASIGAEGGLTGIKAYADGVKEDNNKSLMNDFAQYQNNEGAIKELKTRKNGLSDKMLSDTAHDANSADSLQGRKDFRDYEINHPLKAPSREPSPEERQFYIDALAKEMKGKFSDQEIANAASTLADAKTIEELQKANKVNAGVIAGVSKAGPKPDKALGDTELGKMAEIDSLSSGLKTSLKGLEALTKDDPSILAKDFASLPTGSDLYNQLAILKAQGAQGAKRLEGRVNDTTLGLYTNMVNSIDTEPIAATKKRIQMFVDSLDSDVAAKSKFFTEHGRSMGGASATPTPTPDPVSGGGSSVEDILKKHGISY